MSNVKNPGAPSGENNIIYLDFLRILSCLLVIGVHVSSSNITAYGFRGLNFGVAYGADWLSLLGVPLFFMISGALTLAPSYDASLRKILVHKVLHYFFLYYLWRLLYQLYSISGEPITWERLIKSIGPEGATFYHLWFLGSIAILYLLLPLLRSAFSDNFDNCRYFIVLYFILILLIPQLLHLPFRGIDWLRGFYTGHDWSMLGGYAGYFVLGYYLHNRGADFSKKQCGILYGAGIFSGILAISIGYFASKQSFVLADYMTSPLTATSFFGAVAIFLLFRRISSKLPGPAWLHVLSRQTLGIYLLHPLFLILLGRAGLDTTKMNTLISIPLLVVLLFLICGVISFLLGKIPLLKRIVQ